MSVNRSNAPDGQSSHGLNDSLPLHTNNRHVYNPQSLHIRVCTHIPLGDAAGRPTRGGWPREWARRRTRHARRGRCRPPCCLFGFGGLERVVSGLTDWRRPGPSRVYVCRGSGRVRSGVQVDSIQTRGLLLMLSADQTYHVAVGGWESRLSLRVVCCAWACVRVMV